jgi:hypothetical protein
LVNICFRFSWFFHPSSCIDRLFPLLYARAVHHNTVASCAVLAQERADDICQIPPDLVVKFQTIDIVEII